MAATFEPVRLQPSQLDEAAAMLGRAFLDDPPLVYAIPDPDERARLLPTPSERPAISRPSNRVIHPSTTAWDSSTSPRRR
jgi:hypothetical protein